MPTPTREPARPLRTVFVGTVEGSRVAFEALVEAGLPPAMLVTLPPEVAHRHSDFCDLVPLAQGAGAAVHLTTNVNAPATLAVLEAFAPDLVLVIGWSQICHAPFRAVAKVGAVGFHPAPLPRFRGRAVIPWTILCGETTSGSTFFWLDAGVDSGPILAQRLFPVAPDETARTLYDKHKWSLSELTPRVVARIAAGETEGTPQDERQAVTCARRTMEDGLIDWRAPAETVLRLVRAAGDPYPGAFTFGPEGRIVVEAARPFAPAGRYVGLPGQVQTVGGAGFTVLCGDGAAIEVTAFRSEAGRAPRVHSKLGDAAPAVAAAPARPMAPAAPVRLAQGA